MKINPHLVEELIEEAEEELVVVINPNQTLTIDPDEPDEDGISYTS